MGTVFHTFNFVSSFVLLSWRVGIAESEDVMVAREGSLTTLVCTNSIIRGGVAVVWMVKPVGEKEWKLLFRADEFSASADKDLHLADEHFKQTGIFSLMIYPKMKDSGFYTCSITQDKRKVQEKTIMLVILRVTVLPSPVPPQHSTLQLIASVSPQFPFTIITWTTPEGHSMKSEKNAERETEAKLPKVQTDDSGVYTCTVYLWGNSSTGLFPFNVKIDIDRYNVVSFNNTIYYPTISTATTARTPLILNCPGVQGDYVVLYWKPSQNAETKTAYLYDRWRGSTLTTEHSKRAKLAGPPYNSEAGSFAFLLTPEGIGQSGTYICDVYHNDVLNTQRTELSVLKVEVARSPSMLTLTCKYSWLAQVTRVIWTHPDKVLKQNAVKPGIITTSVPLPVTSGTAGNYTCTLKLKNGKTVQATQAVTMPPEETKGENENDNVESHSMLPALFALLLLVPLAAAAVGVLLWRQKQISDRGIEQSLSVHIGEAENIYENPDDIKQQAPPQSSVYMDLKPTGEDDVYKELERSAQCQS